MSMHIIQDFSKWKKINEQDLPPRERERGVENNKIVAIPLDATSLKIKIVNDTDVIDANGKLTNMTFTFIMDWLKKQTAIWNYYKAKLGDLSTNVVVYSIAKDNSRKQVVVFNIYSKTALKQQDPTKPGINPAVQFIREDEISTALDGKILGSGAQVNQTQSADQTALKLPIKSAEIMNSTSTPLITFIKDTYNKVKAKVTGNPILATVKSEVVASKLGTGSQTFVKALNSGFGILDATFNEDTEKDITQSLVDKLAKPEELNVEGFNKVASVTQPVNAGDIKVPVGGFREGIQGDPELKKVQDLLSKKLARHLRDHATYQAFVKAGKNGFVGNYGPLTHNLVVLLKSIAENPPYPNKDGSIIEPDFVQMIQEINESFYIGLDGSTLLTESTFNFSNAGAIQLNEPAATQDKSTPAKKKIKSSTSSTSTKPEGLDVKAFQKWMVTSGKDGWSNSDVDNIWGPKTSTAWNKWSDEWSQYIPSEEEDTDKVDVADQPSKDAVDKMFDSLVQNIEKYVENSMNFEKYFNSADAWNKGIAQEWKNTWYPEYTKIKKVVASLDQNDSDTSRYTTNLSRILKMFKGYKFMNTWNGNTDDDSFYINILYHATRAGGNYRAYKITCDF